MKNAIIKFLTISTILVSINTMAIGMPPLSDKATQILCKDKDSTLKIKMFAENWLQSLNSGVSLFQLLLNPSKQVIQISYIDNSKFYAFAGMNANIFPVGLNQIGIYTTLIDIEAPYNSSNVISIIFDLTKNGKKIKVNSISGNAQYNVKFPGNECQLN